MGVGIGWFRTPPAPPCARGGAEEGAERKKTEQNGRRRSGRRRSGRRRSGRRRSGRRRSGRILRAHEAQRERAPPLHKGGLGGVLQPIAHIPRAAGVQKTKLEVHSCSLCRQSVSSVSVVSQCRQLITALMERESRSHFRPKNPPCPPLCKGGAESVTSQIEKESRPHFRLLIQAGGPQ